VRSSVSAWLPRSSLPSDWPARRWRCSATSRRPTATGGSSAMSGSARISSTRCWSGAATLASPPIRRTSPTPGVSSKPSERRGRNGPGCGASARFRQWDAIRNQPHRRDQRHPRHRRRRQHPTAIRAIRPSASRLLRLTWTARISPTVVSRSSHPIRIASTRTATASVARADSSDTDEPANAPLSDPLARPTGHGITIQDCTDSAVARVTGEDRGGSSVSLQPVVGWVDSSSPNSSGEFPPFPPDPVVARARDPNEASDLAAQGITVRPAD
jgi:hypothetical protein